MFRFRRGGEESQESPGHRLDSWKEMAKYLRRDVSTLHRWEREEGLPVHRHHHRRASSVYAYKAELDAWWTNHLDLPATEKRQAGPLLTHSFLFKTFGLLGILLASAVLGWYITRSERIEDYAKEPLWVLLAEFDGLSKNKAVEATIARALERELANIPGINVVSRPRVEEALRFMKKPVDTRIAPALGREICLRDGDIAALLMGRFEKINDKFLLSIGLINPEDGATVSTYTAEIENEVEGLSAVETLSASLGRDLRIAANRIHPASSGLQKVTTPSLKALQLFSQADSLERELVQSAGNPTDHSKVALLLRSAIAEDPEFASAHCWLAWVQWNQGAPEEAYLMSARKAVECSDQVSERERLIILGSLHALSRSYEDAIPYWEALLERYPDDYWGINNLAEFYRSAGRRKESARLLLRLAELQPEDFELNLRAGLDSISYLDDHDLAGAFIARARGLITPEVLEISPRAVAQIRTYPAFESWLKGEFEEALAVADVLSGELASMRGLQHRALARHLAATYLSLGKLSLARRYYEEAGFGAYSWFLVAYQLEVSLESATSLLEDEKIPKSTHALFVLVRAGLFDEAREMISKLETRKWDRHYSDVVRGLSSWIERDCSQAVASLEEGLSQPLNGIPGFFFLASDFLATILEGQGDLGRALLVLEEASRRKTRVVTMEHLAFWTRNECLLASLYRKVGRIDGAERIERELSQILRYSDPDHPFLVSLGSNR